MGLCGVFKRAEELSGMHETLSILVRELAAGR
jgi:hypothetical protein